MVRDQPAQLLGGAEAAQLPGAVEGVEPRFRDGWAVADVVQPSSCHQQESVCGVYRRDESGCGGADARAVPVPRRWGVEQRSGTVIEITLKEEAKEDGRLIDATQGRKTRAILITDSNHVVLSAIQPETIVNRFEEDIEDESVVQG